MTNTTSAFSVDEVLKASWASVKKDWTKYLTLYAALLLVYILYSVITGVIFKLMHVSMFIEQSFGMVFSIFLGAYFVMVLARGSLMIVHGKKYDVGEIMSFDSKKYLNTLVALILFYIAIMVGFCFFIVPGIIAAIMFGFAFFSIVDKNAGAIQSLEDSMRMTKGNKLNVFFFEFLRQLITVVALMVPSIVIIFATLAIAGGDLRDIHLGLGIVAGVLLGVILLGVSVVSGMMSTAAHAYMYNKMRAKTPLTIAK